MRAHVRDANITVATRRSFVRCERLADAEIHCISLFHLISMFNSFPSYRDRLVLLEGSVLSPRFPSKYWC